MRLPNFLVPEPIVQAARVNQTGGATLSVTPIGHAFAIDTAPNLGPSGSVGSGATLLNFSPQHKLVISTSGLIVP